MALQTFIIIHDDNMNDISHLRIWLADSYDALLDLTTIQPLLVWMARSGDKIDDRW